MKIYRMEYIKIHTSVSNLMPSPILLILTLRKKSTTAFGFEVRVSTWQKKHWFWSDLVQERRYGSGSCIQCGDNQLCDRSGEDQEMVGNC